MHSQERLATACNWIMAGVAVVFAAVVFVQLFSVPPQSSRVQHAVKPFVPPAGVQALPPTMGTNPAVGNSSPAAQPPVSAAPAPEPVAGSRSAIPAQPGMIRGQQENASGRPASLMPPPNSNSRTRPPG